MRRDSFLTDITGFKGFWGLELGFSFSLSSALPSAPVPHNRTLAGSPVMRVHPSGTDWRQERRPQHLQTSSHCMHCHNIVSKITIRTHFSWPKPPDQAEPSTSTVELLAKETRFFQKRPFFTQRNFESMIFIKKSVLVFQKVSLQIVHTSKSSLAVSQSSFQLGSYMVQTLVTVKSRAVDCLGQQHI